MRTIEMDDVTGCDISVQLRGLTLEFENKKKRVRVKMDLWWAGAIAEQLWKVVIHLKGVTANIETKLKGGQ